MLIFQRDDSRNKNKQTNALYLSSCLLKALAVLFLTCALAEPVTTGLPALAQEPDAPFEITISPAAEQAVAGEPFTYFVTLTNTAQISQQNVIITVETPKGTTFRDSEILTQQRWLMGGFDPGQPGRIFWLAQEGLAVGEVAQLTLEVNVLSTAISEIVNQEYNVTTLDNYGMVAISGPPVRTQVIIPTPPLTPTPQPTLTPTLAKTTVAKLADILTPTPTQTPTPIINHKDITISEKIAPTVSQPDILDNTNILLLSVVSVSAIVIGIGWLLIKKRR